MFSYYYISCSVRLCRLVAFIVFRVSFCVFWAHYRFSFCSFFLCFLLRSLCVAITTCITPSYNLLWFECDVRVVWANSHLAGATTNSVWSNRHRQSSNATSSLSHACTWSTYKNTYIDRCRRCSTPHPHPCRLIVLKHTHKHTKIRHPNGNWKWKVFILFFLLFFLLFSLVVHEYEQEHGIWLDIVCVCSVSCYMALCGHS